jgi:hypothetical protein
MGSMNIDIETNLFVCPKAGKMGCNTCPHAEPHALRTFGWREIPCNVYGGDCDAPCVSTKPDWDK